MPRIGGFCWCALREINLQRRNSAMTHGFRSLAITLFFTTALTVAASAGTVRIYITNSAGDSVDVIDSATNKVVQVISGIEVPHGVNFSPDGKRVYISNESERVLDVVDEKSGAILNKIPLSGHPNNIAVTKDGRLVLICI